MKISVCIPLYNGEKYIGRAIDSLLAQTFTDYEILIVDDCSKDKSLEVLSKYKDERIHIYKNEHNLGLANNWNELLKKAQGEYIHFLHDDDILKPDCFEKEMKFLEEHPSVVVLCNATRIIDQNDKPIFTRRFFKKDKVFDGKKFAKKSFRSKNIYGEPSNVIFKREVAVNNKVIYNSKLRYSPDWEFCIKLSLYGDVGVTKDILADYRISTTSETYNLYKNKELLKEDEEELIRSVSSISELNITKRDIRRHKFSIGFRNFEKKTFLFFYSRFKKR